MSDFCEHSASLNAVTEALQLHRGQSFRLFEVSLLA
jgi:hypothetical protein